MLIYSRLSLSPRTVFESRIDKAKGKLAKQYKKENQEKKIFIGRENN